MSENIIKLHNKGEIIKNNIISKNEKQKKLDEQLN